MKNFTFQNRSKKKCSCIRGQIMPTRNNKPWKVNKRVTTSQVEISGKNHISQNVFLPSVIYPSEKKKKILEQAAFWHEVKVVCCLPTRFLIILLIHLSPCFINPCFINPAQFYQSSPVHVLSHAIKAPRVIFPLIVNELAPNTTRNISEVWPTQLSFGLFHTISAISFVPCADIPQVKVLQC